MKNTGSSKHIWTLWHYINAVIIIIIIIKQTQVSINMM